MSPPDQGFARTWCSRMSPENLWSSTPVSSFASPQPPLSAGESLIFVTFSFKLSYQVKYISLFRHVFFLPQECRHHTRTVLSFPVLGPVSRGIFFLDHWLVLTFICLILHLPSLLVSSCRLPLLRSYCPSSLPLLLPIQVTGEAGAIGDNGRRPRHPHL